MKEREKKKKRRASLLKNH